VKTTACRADFNNEPAFWISPPDASTVIFCVER
jgi:hypothetical protein